MRPAAPRAEGMSRHEDALLREVTANPRVRLIRRREPTARCREVRDVPGPDDVGKTLTTPLADTATTPRTAQSDAR
jgi:hypothetical protein